MEEDVASDMQTTVLCIISFMGVFYNGLIFLLMYRKQSMRTFSNRFVTSVASSHFLQCIVIVPYMIAPVRDWLFQNNFCRIMSFLTIFLNLASVLSILLIAIDRNCAVNSPLHYTITITKKRTEVLIIAVWLISVSLSTPILFGISESLFLCSDHSPYPTYPEMVDIVYTLLISFVGFVLPLISVAYLYFAMFRAAQNNNARARRSSSNSNTSNEIVVSLKPAKKQGVAEYSLRRNFSSERVEDSTCCFAGRHKAAVTGLLVVVSFVVCWLPFYTILILELFFNISESVKLCANFAIYISCILNPYLYFFRNKNTYKEAKKMIIYLFTPKEKFSAKSSAEKQSKKCTVNVSPCLFRLPNSFSQPILSLPTTNISSCQENPLDLKAPPKMRSVFSLDPIKPLLHQDSSSSNDSTDVCVTTVVTDSVLSIDQDPSFWCSQFQS